MASNEESGSDPGKPDLSSYFGGESAPIVTAEASVQSTSATNFFDQLEESSMSVLQSCRESRVDLSQIEIANQQPSPPEDTHLEAQLDVIEQRHDDVQSLRRRQMSESLDRKSSSDEQQQQQPQQELELEQTEGGEPMSEQPSLCTIFGETKDSADPFSSITKEEEDLFKAPKTVALDKEKKKLPDSLNLKPNVQVAISEVSTPTNTAPSSTYATPVAPTPKGDHSDPMNFSNASFLTSTPAPPGQLQSGAAVLLQASTSHFQTDQPITSPLPLSPAASNFVPQFNSSASIDESLILPDDEIVPEPLTKADKEDNRRHEAWIPKQATGQILSSIDASNPGTFYPDRSSLTRPCVVIREDLVDPVKNLVAHYRGETETQKRQVLTVETVTRDQKGLRQLVRAGCFRAAVNLTGRLLQMYNQGTGQSGDSSSMAKHTPSSLQIWFARISLLVKLRQFSIAELETTAFGDLDRPDLYFQFYSGMYPNRRGSMVPFAFRILIAEIPQYLGKYHETLDRLYALLATVKKIQDNLLKGKAEDGSKCQFSESDRLASQALWRKREIRVLYSLANSSIIQRDFESAITNLEILLEVEDTKLSAKILSAMGRVYLQLGDIREAETLFSRAFKAQTDNSTEEKVDHLVDLAHLSIGNSDFPNALNHFKKADDLNPDNPTVMNNIALCHIYCGSLKEGLDYLEARITRKPHLILHETVILNLCTIYELESSYASQKKRAILDLVSQYKGDGINAACLKLQM
ncbi:hypothetical protein TCAL_04212 [Tigriopus californicus]|uniref:Uncharacterized protein n=2 Tax=Tigriopus californicus TaxID=6832 RepID=A0A553N782_TIGCA|nr:hypothetical protein TCAL_04212 [Tigriopus californicus]